MREKLMQSDSTRKIKDTAEYSQRAPVDHGISILGHNCSTDKNGTTEARTALQTENSLRCIGRSKSMLFDCVRTQLPHWIPDTRKFSSAKGYAFGEGTSVSNPELMTQSTPRSSTSNDPVNGSSSRHFMPCCSLENFKVNAVLPLKILPPNDSDNQLLDAKMKGVVQEHSHGQRPSVNLVSQKKTASYSALDTTRSIDSVKYNQYLSLDCQPMTSQDSMKMAGNFRGITLLPSQVNNSFEITDSGKKNLGTTSVFTTSMDRVKSIPEGCSRFSTKRDSNLLEKSSTFRTKLLEISGGESSHHQLLQPLYAHGSRGLKRKEMTSRSNEGNGNLKHVGHPTNTGNYALKTTMNTGLLIDKKNYSGDNSAASHKHDDAISSSPEIKLRSPKESGVSKSVDVNMKLLALPAFAFCSEMKCQSSSRSRNLGEDDHFSNTEPPNPECNLHSEADPTTRWVKRLKPSGSNSSDRGSKAHKLSGDILRSNYCSGTSFKKLSTTRRLGKEPIPSGMIQVIPMENEKQILNHEEKGRDLLLSNSWIRRFLKNGWKATDEAHGTGDFSEQHCSKVDMDADLNKKHFPSLAAMALMGRSMNGVRPYETLRKGPVSIYYTKSF